MSGHEMHESLGLAARPSGLDGEKFEGFELCCHATCNCIAKLVGKFS
jgi:hypothetical protein